jgi:hypothetical protein
MSIVQSLLEDAIGVPPPKQYLGKYRGLVVNNIDPLGIGRIQVNVPGVLTVLSSWALPCLPVAGFQMGIVTVPSPGSKVWVEFERGDPDYPIWTGCFWGSKLEVPLMSQVVQPPVPGITMQTPLQNTIQVSDNPPSPLSGGIILRSGTSMIVVNQSGIYISNGQAMITMIGPMVNINLGALVIT